MDSDKGLALSASGNSEACRALQNHSAIKVASSVSEDLKYLFAPVAAAQGKALRGCGASELKNLDWSHGNSE